MRLRVGFVNAFWVGMDDTYFNRHLCLVQLFSHRVSFDMTKQVLSFLRLGVEIDLRHQGC